MQEKGFMPVILGSDHNAYGVARSFHEAYAVNSRAAGVGRLDPTRDSKIISVDVFESFKQGEVFVESLTGLARELKKDNDHLILVACNENYAELVVRNREALKNDYIIPFVDEALMDRLIWKENFYRLCDEYNLDYPQTVVCSRENRDSISLNFEYPVVIKPDDSVSYFDTSFQGKKKAYVASSEKEAREIIDRIYSSAYKNKLIIQEYIPGDDTSMRVLYAYSGQDGKVRMMCLGRILLQDCTPLLIGNYLAVANEYNEELYSKYRTFLEDIGYRGFTNIDLKFDHRDGKFKVFEVNIRQGRSSYFVTGSGYNLARYLVEDTVYNLPRETVFADSEHLWLGVPRGLLFKYLKDSSLRAYAGKLIRAKKVCVTLPYSRDRNLKRTYRELRYGLEYYRRFGRYYREYG